MGKDRLIALIISVVVAVLFGVIVKGINQNNASSKNIVTPINDVKKSDVPNNGGSSKEVQNKPVKKVQKENIKEVKKEPEMYVLVASCNIKKDDIIKTENLSWDLWPKKNISESYISKDEKGNYTHPSLTMESLIGLTAKIDILKGAPITKSFLLEGEVDKSRYALEISAGKRAVAVPVDQMSVKNFVFAPNDFVDVYFCNRTKVIRNVRILALDDFTNKKEESENVDNKVNIQNTKLPQTVTLELSPVKVDYLMKNMKGSVFLAMVSNEETDDIKEADDSSEYEQDDSEFEDEKEDKKDIEKKSDKNESDKVNKEKDTQKDEEHTDEKHSNEKSNGDTDKNIDENHKDGDKKNEHNENPKKDNEEDDGDDEDDEKPKEKTLENDPEDLILIIRKDKAQLFDTSRIGLNQQQQQQGDDDE